MTPDEYAGRCRGLVLSVSESLPSEEVGWAMHLIDHDEPAEGLTSLAWTIEATHGTVDAETASLILVLTDGMVPFGALPSSVQSVAGQGEGTGSSSEPG